MDLDRYVQPVNYGSDTNFSEKHVIGQIINNLNEIENILSSGKQIDTQIKLSIHELYDSVSKILSKIKYNE
jgi:hypothetical protein